MRSQLRLLLRVTIAFLLVLLGLLGLVLPLINGTVFILIALLVLAIDIPWLDKKLDTYSSRHPKLERWHKKFRDVVRKYL